MLEFIKSHFVANIEALNRAMIRYWDSRFIKNDEVEYLRMELDKARNETQRVLDRFLTPQNTAKDETTEDVWKPISNNVPWHIKRAQLEQESYLKSKELSDEASRNIKRTKSIKELEDEVLVK